MNLLNGTQVTSINKRYQVYTVCPKGELDFYLVHKTLLTHTHTHKRAHMRTNTLISTKLEEPV